MVTGSDHLVNKDVLIIGGGISGITAALELARLGIPAILIEREPFLGGASASLSCKASEACNRCFACVVDERISDVQKCGGISLLTETQLVNIDGGPGRYHVFLRRKKEKVELDVAAVVIAVGIDPYDASQKEEYGYRRHKDVITAREMDEMLRLRGTLSRPSNGLPPAKIAFFQCVGSRDESIGNRYCSKVCCAYALRLIRTIRHNHPEVEVTFLYLDIQPAGASFLSLLNSCREDKGIRFVRALPSKVYAPSLSQGLKVRFVDPQRQEVVEEYFDLVVLSVGMVLSKEAWPLVDRFRLPLTEDGFLSTPPEQGGVFVTGACTGPKDIDRSILQAKSTVLHVHQFLRGDLR